MLLILTKVCFFYRSQSLSTLKGGLGAGRIHIARPWLKKKTSLPTYSLNDINACHREEEEEEEESYKPAAAARLQSMSNLRGDESSTSEEEAEAARGALLAHERRRMALKKMLEEGTAAASVRSSKVLTSLGVMTGQRSDGVTDDDEDVVY